MGKHITVNSTEKENTEKRKRVGDDKNISGAEYSNLVDDQNISEIELYVSSVEN